MGLVLTISWENAPELKEKITKLATGRGYQPETSGPNEFVTTATGDSKDKLAGLVGILRIEFPDTAFKWAIVPADDCI